jgi:hypothetical protein
MAVAPHPREAEIVGKLRLAREFQMNDLRRSIFLAKTNFLTALGLVNYTEFWGHFLTGTEAARAAFDEFFRYMGGSYLIALQNEPTIYGLLRCGLAHEYVPKQRAFTIFGEDADLSDDQIRASPQRQHGVEVTTAAIAVKNSRFYVDLKEAVDRLISEVPQRLQTAGSSVERRFDKINFAHFV